MEQQSTVETETTNGMLTGEDVLPLEIAETDTQVKLFNHRGVRAVLANPTVEKAQPATAERKADWWYREGKDTYALQCSFMFRADQPDHPDLVDFKGTRISFVRFIIAQGQRGQQNYLDICKAYGLNPRSPDLRAITDVPVIISVKSRLGKPGTPAEGQVFHDVNKVIRDVDFEQAHA